MSHIIIAKFINELMSSNCYVISNEDTSSCIIIDPGSEEEKEVIDYIEKKAIIPAYIIITHEHTDHNWGVNVLKEKYGCDIWCSKECDLNMRNNNSSYFQLYYNKTNYQYIIAPVSYLIPSYDTNAKWKDIDLRIYYTPGHSIGSICILIQNNLFTGDTLMQYRPYIDKKTGSVDDWKKSTKRLFTLLKGKNIMVYPGHGEQFLLNDFDYNEDTCQIAIV